MGWGGSVGVTLFLQHYGGVALFLQHDGGVALSLQHDGGITTSTGDTACFAVLCICMSDI